METIGIVTSIYGGFDKLVELPDNHGFDDAVCVTDRPTWSDTWRVIVEPRGVDSRIASKIAKCLPWEYTDTDCSLWVDGSIIVDNRGRLEVEKHLALNDLVAWNHWENRNDIYEEAYYSKAFPKYINTSIIEQAEHYRSQGFPTDSGLFEVGMTARRHTEPIKQFGYNWLSEQIRWSIQDQVSFPYVAWKHGITVGTWEHTRPATGWAYFTWHDSND